MFKKLLILSTALAVSINIAFAKNVATGGNVIYQKPVHYKEAVSYKGDAHYKGEVIEVRQLHTPPPELFPCKTYTFNPGFYIGLNPGLRTTYSPQASAVYKGIEGTIFGGYTFTSLDWYFAAEIYGSHGAELQNYTNAVNANGNLIGLRSTWSLGLSLLPGYVVSDTLLLYLRLGSATTHFQDVARTKTGGQVGVGIQGTVSESWDLRAEYVYSFYPSLPVLGSPRSDQFRIGLVYKL